MSEIEPPCDQSAPFLMWVENVFFVTGNGTTITGYVQRGSLNLYDLVEVVGMGLRPPRLRPTNATMMDQGHKLAKTIVCGEQAGILLRALDIRFAEVGQVIAAPDSIQAYTKFRGNIQVVGETEGSDKHVFIADEEVQFFFRNVYVPGTYTFLDGLELVACATRVILICTLARPVAMEEGQEFTVYSNGKAVGAGKVVELIKKF